MKHGEIIKNKILDAVVKLWAEIGLFPTVREIAREVGLNSHSAVLYHFGYNGENIRQEASEHAVKTDNSRVISMLILSRSPVIAKMSQVQRIKHLRQAELL